ncbi:hypothetical protein ES332_A01G084900v1 [Gossypium tomentosum]|uniref:Receptor-like serine/threonine-protein kinase n=1 Tax=Gossypium tomentosum TaxID=34277 RepID=A0A5D2RN63_GOSTO|nr:hypothetical protein ES332_A01G084900v1 [Gossypium tomentosum]
MGFYFYTACCFLIIFSKASTAIDTLSQSDSLTDGMTLNRYLGIWYNNITGQTIVWVANRVNPINDSNGLLKIKSNGKILLLIQNTTAVWWTNSTARVENPLLQLLDSGNLVVRDGKDSEPENYLWQSFDYPSDTILPGMKIGINLRTGLNRRLAAWKNWDDPSPGDFTFGEELQGNPKMVQRKGSEKYYRNGHGFSGTPNLRSNPIFCYYFVWNENEVYYIYSPKNKSVMSRFVLNQTQSVRQRYTWNPETQTWKLFSITPSDLCDRSGICGPNGNCDNNKLPACQCLTSSYSKSLNCKSGDGFIRIGKVKIPKTTNSWVNKTMNLKQCRAKCLRNCSCMAYTNLYVRRGGSGCAIWFGNLLDIKQFQSDGQDLYIRLSASEADEVKDKNLNDREDKDENEDMALAVFEFRTIAQATDSFSFNNKLGQGGFGPVFKGTLGNGQEIAAKRLSKSSGQGLNEFKNEVKLIAKLQHRNLVMLLGCCIHGDERMLVYEYMPNRSLDLSNETHSLIWSKRFQIICGIARGLLYLHQGLRLRIIHRDLKTRTNVLLDSEMNPKILDFEANPNRVVGTYGYMAPEYAIDGLFSVKLDIFSFGILLLEIISGRKNIGFYHVNQNGNLIKHAWRLYKEGKPLDLADDFLAETGDLFELLQPSMSSLVLMLGSHTKLPSPKQPRFLFYKKPFEADCSFRNDGLPSRNEISLSLLEAR